MTSKVYELKVKIDSTTGGLTKDAQVEYSVYGDSSVINVRSSPNYLAVNTMSFEDAFARIQLFKRTSFSGNASATQVFYSQDLSQLININKRSYASANYWVYMKPGETTTRMMIEDLWTTGVAKVYSVADSVVQTQSVGYYDQLRLNNVNLVVNEKMVLTSSQPLLSTFMNPGTQSTTINDLTSESIFTKYLWLWITIGSVILVAVIVIVCYYCRSDSIDKYKINL